MAHDVTKLGKTLRGPVALFVFKAAFLLLCLRGGKPVTKLQEAVSHGTIGSFHAHFGVIDTLRNLIGKIGEPLETYGNTIDGLIEASYLRLVFGKEMVWHNAVLERRYKRLRTCIIDLEVAEYKHPYKQYRQEHRHRQYCRYDSLPRNLFADLLVASHKAIVMSHIHLVEGLTHLVKRAYLLNTKKLAGKLYATIYYKAYDVLVYILVNDKFVFELI